MNERAVAYALTRSPCSGTALSVHVAMAYYAERGSGEVLATTAEIAAMARSSPNTVRRTQALLVEVGVIEMMENAAGSRSARYRIARQQGTTNSRVVLQESSTNSEVVLQESSTNDSEAEAVPLSLTKSTTQARSDSKVEVGTSVSLALNVGDDAVALIFKAWQQATGHTRAVLDKKRKAAIVNARRLYPDGDLLAAVNGVTLSAHNMGGTNGTRYDDITLVLRDATHIERFRDLWMGDDSGRPDPRRHRVAGGAVRAALRGGERGTQ